MQAAGAFAARLGMALALLAAMSLAGCADNGSGAWHGRDLEAPGWRDTQLEPGWALEMDFPLRQGEELPYDWFVMDRTDIGFEIHYHTPDGADVVPVRGEFAQHTGPFVAKVSAMHSLLWKNAGEAPVELWILVEGEQCYRDADGKSRCGTLVEL